MRRASRRGSAVVVSTFIEYRTCTSRTYMPLSIASPPLHARSHVSGLILLTFQRHPTIELSAFSRIRERFVFPAWQSFDYNKCLLSDGRFFFGWSLRVWVLSLLIALLRVAGIFFLRRGRRFNGLFAFARFFFTRRERDTKGFRLYDLWLVGPNFLQIAGGRDRHRGANSFLVGYLRWRVSNMSIENVRNM